MTQVKSVHKQYSTMRSKLPSYPNLPKLDTFVQNEAVIKKAKQFVQADRKPHPKRFRLTIFVFASSLLMFLAFDPMINFVIDYNMQLRPDGLTTGSWKRNPVPIHSCWYIFGLRNGLSFLNGSRPYMEEHGPICYDLYRERRILEWRDDSVKFVEKMEFKFNPTLSNPLATEQFTMINLPIFVGVLSAKALMEQFYVGFLGPLVYNTMVATLRASGEGPLEEITTRQLMEGRKIKIVEYIDLILRPLRSIGIPLPDLKEGFLGVIDHSVGIASAASFFELGPYEAWTRTEADHVVGHAFKFDGMSTYPAYEPPCNRLGGSDGIFHSKPVVDQHLYFYIHHLCRQIRFDRNLSMYYNGAQVVRYNMDPNMFKARLKRNRCFCLGGRPWQDCDGWSSIGPCAFGLPVGISFPHFFNSPRRRREIYGLKPDPEKHHGFLYMEPQFGVPVKAKIRIQVVLQVTPVGSVSELANVRPVKLPLLWVEMTPIRPCLALRSLWDPTLFVMDRWASYLVVSVYLLCYFYEHYFDSKCAVNEHSYDK